MLKYFCNSLYFFYHLLQSFSNRSIILVNLMISLVQMKYPVINSIRYWGKKLWHFQFTQSTYQFSSRNTLGVSFCFILSAFLQIYIKKSWTNRSDKNTLLESYIRKKCYFMIKIYFLKCTQSTEGKSYANARTIEKKRQERCLNKEMKKFYSSFAQEFLTPKKVKMNRVMVNYVFMSPKNLCLYNQKKKKIDGRCL